MKIEIDQSGKLEDTHKPTVIGFYGIKNKTIMILAPEKQRLQKYFRKINKPRIYIYATFSILICLLIKNERNISEMIIDREYPGKEALIKNYLLTYFKKINRDIDKRSIYFRELGKKASVHELVVTSYRQKKADIKVTSRDIIDFAIKKSGVL